MPVIKPGVQPLLIRPRRHSIKRRPPAKNKRLFAGYANAGEDKPPLGARSCRMPDKTKYVRQDPGKMMLAKKS